MTTAVSAPRGHEFVHLRLTDVTHIEQVMMEALTSKKAIAERHKEALRDMEEYFGVKGLLANAATVTYNRHNARVPKAIQAAAAAAAVQSAGGHACLTVCLKLALVK